MTNNAHLPQPYDVWRLAFYFEDKPDVVKERPVVVLNCNSKTGQVLIAGAKVTSHAPRPDFPWRGAAEKLDAGRLAEAVRRSMLQNRAVQPKCL